MSRGSWKEETLLKGLAYEAHRGKLRRFSSFQDAREKTNIRTLLGLPHIPTAPEQIITLCYSQEAPNLATFISRCHNKNK